MSVFIGRIMAAVASFIVVWVVGLIGLPVTEGQQASVIEWLTTGLTALGGFLALLLYGPLHKLINAKFNPADTAKNPEVAASVIAGGDN